MDPIDAITRRHLRFGWWCLLVFLSVGIVLEALHGFKVGWYLNVSNETRRLMFRLAHAHGVLLALTQVAFAVTLRASAVSQGAWMVRASRSLRIAGVLIPGGFLLGGLIVWGGDPWVGVLLVPVGAVFLLVAVWSTARGIA